MVTELMKQPQYAPMSVSEMAVTLYAAEKGFYRDMDVKRALDFERSLFSYLKQNAADVLDKVESTKKLDKETEQQLSDAITAFKKTWV